VPARQARLDAFAQQYRLVREREGRRSQSAEYYRMLPQVAADDPYVRDWQIRQETYRHLLRHVFAWGQQPSAVLDLGAGSGWLSHRLATLGHHVAAVDAIEDEADGLGAIRHYDAPIVAVHADFDAPPFAAEQFDVVIFNGSLHYAPDASATLASARRMLADGGTLVVMDSPMFDADRDGAVMVEQVVRRIAAECGLCEVVRPGSGYLTFPSLAASAGALQMASEFVPSRGSIGWRMRRRLASLRLGRQPAAFGLWVAR
jgi:SAM-dependent methyltransferase